MSNPVPQGWKLTTLEKNARLITDGAHLSPATSNDGKPIATVQNMRSRSIDISSCRLISANDFDALVKGNCSPEAGDVLFSKDGTVGKTFVYDQPDKIVLLSSIAIIRLDPQQLDPVFCSQFLLSPLFYNTLENTKSGSAIRRIVLSDLKKLELPKPPLPEQQKIATILSSVDDVIEKTRAQIDKLKDLKTGMMQELFTKGIVQTESNDSSGVWSVKTIGDLVKKVGSGITPSGGSASYVDVGIPFIRSQNVHSDGLRLDNVSYITEDQHQKMAGSQLMPDDVLLNITGASIGRCYYLPADFIEGNVNQHVCIIRVKKAVVNPMFLTLFLNSEFGQGQIMSLQAGGNREGLNFQQIRSIKLPLPSIKEQEEIVGITFSIEENIRYKSKKLSSLVNTKKALMQDLLTGKVRVNLTDKESAAS